MSMIPGVRAVALPGMGTGMRHGVLRPLPGVAGNSAGLSSRLYLLTKEERFDPLKLSLDDFQDLRLRPLDYPSGLDAHTLPVNRRKLSCNIPCIMQSM